MVNIKGFCPLLEVVYSNNKPHRETDLVTFTQTMHEWYLKYFGLLDTSETWLERKKINCGVQSSDFIKSFIEKLESMYNLE